LGQRRRRIKERASSASGGVTGGGNSVLGGFIGAPSFQNGPGEITNSIARGPVTSTGPNSVVGGFVGLTSGTPVNGTSSGYLGGFVGTNLGLIAHRGVQGARRSPGSECCLANARSTAKHGLNDALAA
jgi:hypothetical protein